MIATFARKMLREIESADPQALDTIPTAVQSKVWNSLLVDVEDYALVFPVWLNTLGLDQCLLNSAGSTGPDFGLVNTLMVTSPTVRQALANLTVYQSVFAKTVDTYLVGDQCGNLVLQVANRYPITSELEQQFSELQALVWLGSIGNILRFMVGTTLPRIPAVFPGQKPKNWDAIKDKLEVDARAEPTGTCSITIPASILDLQPIQHDLLYYYAVLDSTAAAMTALSVKNYNTMMVAGHISAMPSAAKCRATAEQVGGLLNQSARTLQRSLQAEGSTFNQVKNNCLYSMCQTQYEAGMSDAQIAANMGRSLPKFRQWYSAQQ